jgi:hypothetical protein
MNARLEHREKLLRNPLTGKMEWVKVSDLVPQPGTNGIAKWPIHSDAMGINPSQVAEAQAVLAAHGVSTEYDNQGRPVLTDARHRRRHAEALGFFDRNGGYGDPQRK